MSEESSKFMMDAITEATAKITALRQHGILQQAFKLVSNILVKCGTPFDEPWDTTKILTENQADLQTSAELLGELAKEVIQLRKAKIVFDAAETAKEVYLRHDNEGKPSTEVVPGSAPAQEERDVE